MKTRTMVDFEFENVRIVIPSCKREVATLNCLNECPVHFELVISRKHGVSAARNDGAKNAWGNLLVFLDDDLLLNPMVWNVILTVELGEFAMTFLKGFPCSRVLAVHSVDFWSVGGFDENIRFTGEDRDFYVRALEYGLKFKRIPYCLVKHKDHAGRNLNIHVALQMVKENVFFIRKYWRKYPAVFRFDVLDRMKRFQIRTLTLMVFWFYFFMFQELKRK